MTALERMERQATLLGDDLDVLAAYESLTWDRMLRELEGSGVPTMAGETQNYHETRNPFKQTADYTAVVMATTSKSVLTATTDLLGSSLAFPIGYWDLGKKVHFRFFGRMTTVLTPGNLVIEIRHQTGAAPSDAGGTILATSAATALAASKTNISWFMDFTVEARGPLGTAAALFSKGWFMYDGAGALFTTTAQNPLFVPGTAPAPVNVDTTQASYITLQMKRSGSTAETLQVHDFQVNSLT